MVPLFYHFLNFLGKVTFFVVARWEVHGREHVPRQGPLVLVANHLSMVDPALVAASVPRRIVFMAKRELYGSPVSGLFMRAVGAIRVNRGASDRKALRQALAALAQGRAIGIFPEGTRSREGRLQQAHGGAALIALHSGAPILPLGVYGTEEVKGLSSLLRRPRMVVNIGRPFNIPVPEGRIGASDLALGTDVVMAQIAALLPEDYRGTKFGGGATEDAAVGIAVQ